MIRMFGYFDNFEVSKMDVLNETKNSQIRKRFSDKLTWKSRPNFFVSALYKNLKCIVTVSNAQKNKFPLLLKSFIKRIVVADYKQCL